MARSGSDYLVIIGALMLYLAGSTIWYSSLSSTDIPGIPRIMVREMVDILPLEMLLVITATVYAICSMIFYRSFRKKRKTRAPDMITYQPATLPIEESRVPLKDGKHSFKDVGVYGRMSVAAND